MLLDAITWTADPVLFTWGPVQLRWYALMFIVGFMFGGWLMERIYAREGLNPDRVASLFLWCFVGTLVGARLGHCLFYDPGYYLANPIEIFKTWKGGLASHGGTIGVITCVWIYARRDKLPFLWVLDRLCIAVAPVAFLIRMGNLFNHEIYGHVTDLPWGFRFISNVSAWSERGADPAFTDPSHPTQLYEGLAYLLAFAVLLILYYRTQAPRRTGLLFGIFLNAIFFSRFLIEFVKNDQEAFEADMTLNMGQLLSIPFILIGCWLIWRSLHRPLAPAVTPDRK